MAQQMHAGPCGTHRYSRRSTFGEPGQKYRQGEQIAKEYDHGVGQVAADQLYAGADHGESRRARNRQQSAAAQVSHSAGHSGH